MAIALDANLGSTSTASGTTLTLTTANAAAANTIIIVLVSWFSGSGTKTISSLTVGGSAATQDKHVTNGSDLFDIWSFQAPSGLASSSAITATWAATAGAMLIGAVSFTGVATTTPLVTTGSATGTGSSWSSGAATNTGQADALYIGGAGNEDATNPTSSTASSGTELHDLYNATGGQGMATGYKIVSVVASDSITGTWSNANSTANTGALAIYAAATTATAIFVPHRMPLGV